MRRLLLHNLFALVAISGSVCGLTRVQATQDEQVCHLNESQTIDFVRAVSRIRYETHKIRPKLKRCETFVERIRQEQDKAGVLPVQVQDVERSIILSEISKIIEPRCTGPVNGLSSLLEFVGDCLELIELSKADKTIQEQRDTIAELKSKLEKAAAEVKSKSYYEKLSSPAVSAREITVKKDSLGKVGIVLDRIFLGSAFVVFVTAGSPAAHAGLRFGDQVIAINGRLMADERRDEASERLGDSFTYLVKKAPFEQTIIIDASAGQKIGIELNRNGKVVAVDSDSAAARAGLLRDVNIITINGRYVIGFTDREILRELNKSAGRGERVQLSVIPSLALDLLTQRLRRDGHDLTRISEEGNKILDEQAESD